MWEHGCIWFWERGKSSFFLWNNDTSRAAPLHVTHCIVAARLCDLASGPILTSTCQYRQAKRPLKRRISKRFKVQIKEPFTEANCLLLYWSGLTFGPMICCFIFKSDSSGALFEQQFQVWQPRITNRWLYKKGRKRRCARFCPHLFQCNHTL